MAQHWRFECAFNIVPDVAHVVGGRFEYLHTVIVIVFYDLAQLRVVAKLKYYIFKKFILFKAKVFEVGVLA